jgi:hypothetical protein
MLSLTALRSFNVAPPSWAVAVRPATAVAAKAAAEAVKKSRRSIMFELLMFCARELCQENDQAAQGQKTMTSFRSIGLQSPRAGATLIFAPVRSHPLLSMDSIES